MENNELYKIAKKNATSYKPNKVTRIGHVSVALIAQNKKIYTGVSIETGCSLGTCAEYNAIASMVQDGETRIIKLIAVNEEGKIYSPCGKCREYIYQINNDNINTEIILKDKTVRMEYLLPEL